MGKITAHRDGQTRQFTPRVWEAMGIGKCGWESVPEVPKEVAKAIYAPPGAVKAEGILDFAKPTQTHKKRRK